MPASTQHSALSTQRSTAIRPLDTVAEYTACQEIQRRAWGINQDGYLMPVSLLASVHKHGGLVLGAFLDEQLVAFSFAFLARLGEATGLYSQLTAVLPGYQGKGIGYLLKQAQREQARQRQLALIAWAFDPLQASNAAFNLAKLRARCRRYEVNMYGPRSDSLNAGLDTDRLIAEWPVDEAEPARPRKAGERRGQRALVLRPDGAWSRPERAEPVGSQRLELDIPTDIQALKCDRPDLALLWQERVREAFREAFAAGYQATDFASSADDRRCWYVLERG